MSRLSRMPRMLEPRFNLLEHSIDYIDTKQNPSNLIINLLANILETKLILLEQPGFNLLESSIDILIDNISFLQYAEHKA